MTFYVEWVCGVNPIPSNQFITTMEDKELNAIFALNPYNEEFQEGLPSSHLTGHVPE